MGKIIVAATIHPIIEQTESQRRTETKDPFIGARTFLVLKH